MYVFMHVAILIYYPHAHQTGTLILNWVNVECETAQFSASLIGVSLSKPTSTVQHCVNGMYVLCMYDTPVTF